MKPICGENETGNLEARSSSYPALPTPSVGGGGKPMMGSAGNGPLAREDASDGMFRAQFSFQVDKRRAACCVFSGIPSDLSQRVGFRFKVKVFSEILSEMCCCGLVYCCCSATSSSSSSSSSSPAWFYGAALVCLYLYLLVDRLQVNYSFA